MLLYPQAAVSPRSSPTLGGAGQSNLATHSRAARREKTRTLPPASSQGGDAFMEMRRMSDSALQVSTVDSDFTFSETTTINY